MVLLLANSVTKTSSFKEKHQKHFYHSLRCFLECKAMVSCRFPYLPKLKLLLLCPASRHISLVNTFTRLPQHRNSPGKVLKPPPAMVSMASIKSTNF